MHFGFFWASDLGHYYRPEAVGPFCEAVVSVGKRRSKIAYPI